MVKGICTNKFHSFSNSVIEWFIINSLHIMIFDEEQRMVTMERSPYLELFNFFLIFL